MNIAFLTRSISRDAGGIFEVETALARELTQLGCMVTAFGPHDSNAEVDRVKWAPVVPQTLPHLGNDSFRYSPQLKSTFLNHHCDLLHLHSLWSHTSVIASAWAKRTGGPLLVSPNGMLDPWALGNSAIKKRLVSMLFERQMLKRAKCIQANTLKDIEDFRKYGLRNAFATIPNGVYLPNENHLPSLSQRLQSGGRRKIVYLGRIHRKKGLANTVKAWGEIRKESKINDWQLVIAGRDEGDHLSELNRICLDYGLKVSGEKVSDEDADIVFKGPTYGDEKLSLLTSADLFILPSFSEGLPMAVLEAWAHQTPVMMSRKCNLDIGFEVGAAISTDTSVDSIQKALSEVFDRRPSELLDMGQKGFELVKSKFTWPSVANQMQRLYRWMLGGGDHPDFVTLKSH